MCGRHVHASLEWYRLCVQALRVRPAVTNQQANADAEVRELFSAGQRAFWNAHKHPPPVEAHEGDSDPASASEEEPPAEAPAEQELPEGVIDIGILAGSLTGNLIAGVHEPMFRSASAEDAADAVEAVPTAPLKRLRMRNAAIHTNLFQRLCCAVTQDFIASTTVLAMAEAGQPSWSVVQHLQQLESLDISDMPVGNGPLMQLLPMLSCLGSLREFRAENCSMQWLGLNMVCSSMPDTARCLTLLDWSSNSIAGGTRRDTLRHLSKLTALQDLQLRHCGIGPEEALALALALPRLRALRRLDLARNGLGGEGAAAVVAAAAELPDLRYLHCGARFGVDEAAVRAALPEVVVFELSP